jgi:hypothetical protein
MRHEQIDLAYELAVAMTEAPQNLAERLHIGRRAVLRAGGIGYGFIQTNRATFDFVGPEMGGTAAVILPVYDTPYARCSLDLIDLVAFCHDNPSRWWLRMQVAKCLGPWAERVTRNATPLWRLPGDNPPVLRVCRDPLSWLQAQCAGVMPLHECWVQHLLSGLRVQAEDATHGLTLKTQLSHHDEPEIFVPARQGDA